MRTIYGKHLRKKEALAFYHAHMVRFFLLRSTECCFPAYSNNTGTRGIERNERSGFRDGNHAAEILSRLCQLVRNFIASAKLDSLSRSLVNADVRFIARKMLAIVTILIVLVAL